MVILLQNEIYCLYAELELLKPHNNALVTLVIERLPCGGDGVIPISSEIAFAHTEDANIMLTYLHHSPK